MAARVLAVIERGYRGSAEVQYSDLLYVCAGLHRQLGGVDLVLRGSAVTFAVESGAAPALRVGSRTLGTVPDPRSSVDALVRAGVRIWVDRLDLAELGLEKSTLIDGVTDGDTDALANNWHEYEEVWFL